MDKVYCSASVVGDMGVAVGNISIVLIQITLQLNRYLHRNIFVAKLRVFIAKPCFAKKITSHMLGE